MDTFLREEKNYQKMVKLSGKKGIKLSHTPNVSGGPSRRCPDISKIKKMGYKPRFSLSKGIKQVLKKNNLIKQL